jgi:2-amino-4-hydroxy-6-hydroxymethyldihydropteridine diphosphokinase
MKNPGHPTTDAALRTPHSAVAVVALGSNLGDSRQIVLDAMARLQDFSDRPILKSSLWQTSPVDCPPGSPKFVNAVVRLVPRKGETPESLLKKLQELEKEFGRSAGNILNEPRSLDLDLIAFGTETRLSPDLILPHPRAQVRRFVLQPLNEIAPELVLAGQAKTVAQLLAELPAGEAVTRLDLQESG